MAVNLTYEAGQGEQHTTTQIDTGDAGSNVEIRLQVRTGGQEFRSVSISPNSEVSIVHEVSSTAPGVTIAKATFGTQFNPALADKIRHAYHGFKDGNILDATEAGDVQALISEAFATIPPQAKASASSPVKGK